MKVIAFGEILWDVIDGQYLIGGAPLNFAAHFKQCGGESAIYSKVGNDENGRRAIEKLKALQLDLNFVQTDNIHPTGLVNVILKNGQPAYTIDKDVAYDYILPPLESLPDFDALYFGTLAQRNETSRNTLIKLLRNNIFQHIFYDVNLRKDGYTQNIILDSLGSCTILKLNDEEVNTLSSMIWHKEMNFDEFMRNVFDSYAQIKTIILTKGSKGCSIYEKGSEVIEVPSLPVVVKDTVGAGDAFSASFLYSYLIGCQVTESAVLANRIAGFVASQEGPIPNYSDSLKIEISKIHGKR